MTDNNITNRFSDDFLVPRCPFCAKIVDGSAEQISATTYIFEPLGPVTEGHMLFIPALHAEKNDRLPTSHTTIGLVFADAFKYAEERCSDYNLIINAGEYASQTIDHLHVHYVPRRPHDGLRLPWTRDRYHPLFDTRIS